MTNSLNGKVVLLCSTIKAHELRICLEKFPQELLNQVLFTTLDLSPTFEKVESENFPNAVQITVKFHVIKNGIEYLQAIRNRLKQNELKKQREEQLKHEQNYKESKRPNMIGPQMKISKKHFSKRLSNGKLYLKCSQEADTYF